MAGRGSGPAPHETRSFARFQTDAKRSRGILGAVLAGGRSRRFGSDKAVALLDGQTLIGRVIAALRDQTDALLICGRAFDGLPSVPDRPAADLGPLGGLCAALHYASEHGFAGVVSAPCDTPFLPADLVARLDVGAGAAFVASLPVIGWWPASLGRVLDRHLATSDDRSMHRWARDIRARAVDLGAIRNINSAADLLP